MKRTKNILIALLCAALAAVCLPAAQSAYADTVTFSVTTSTAPQSIALMDAAGQVLSSVTRSQTIGNQKVWLLDVTNNGATTAYLYEQDTNGNWLNANKSYPMDMLFHGSVVQATPAIATVATPVPVATSTTNPYPVLSYSRTPVHAYPLPDDQRVQSRCGPSREYHGAGAYKTYKMTSTEAMFIEGSYMLVDLSYTTVGSRCVYFRLSDFYGWDNVPEVDLVGEPAKTTEELTPRFGPGKRYDSFDEAIISAGTTLSVFFEENGWVFAEFACALGDVRAWIPTSQVVMQ